MNTPIPPVHVLIVEDSESVRLYVRRMVEGAVARAKVLEAEDVQAAFAAMQGQRVDLIVTDLAMDGMDGASFLRLLKHNAELAKMPVLVHSGSITQELRDHYAGHDDVAFLAKPARGAELVQAVKKLLKVDA